MADKTLFGRLKRLFSRDVIVRTVGQGQVRVVDLRQTQQTGKLQSNSLIDRTSGIYRSSVGNYGIPNATSNQLLRTQYYLDYEAMDKDAYIHSALNLLADESTLKDEAGQVIKITSSDETIKRILHNLFYEVLNVEFNLWGWVRNLCKYGDHFMFLKIVEGHGVVGCLPLSAYCVVREEDLETGNVRFLYEPAVIGAAYGGERKLYDEYEIAHFRMLGDTNFLPYGLSYIEGARMTWKSLNLAEDASLLHRITRSADKRMFFIDIGGIEQSAVEAYVQKIIQQTKKVPHIDPQTGDYNLRYNIQNLLEDYYLPVRPGDNNTRIETLPGLQFAGMEDVEYWKKKLFASLMIPKAYFGEEGDTQGKGTLSQLDLRLARLIERLQRIVISELKKIAFVHLYTQGYTDNNLFNYEITLNNPSIVYKQERIGLMQQIVELAQAMMESNLMPSDWVYKNLLELSEDEVAEIRDLVVEDKKRTFRLVQIENEGNDPAETGYSVGTRHDLAMLSTDRMSLPQSYGGYSSSPFPPANGDEGGRPPLSVSGYGTDSSPFGRDAIGTKANQPGGLDKELNPGFQNGGPLAMTESQLPQKLVEYLQQKEKRRKISLFESKQTGVSNLDDLSMFDEKLLEE